MATTRDAIASQSTSALAREWETYQHLPPELVAGHAGEHVLIHGEDVLGFFSSREDALRAGYARVGIVPFLVQELPDAGPVVTLPPYLA